MEVSWMRDKNSSRALFVPCPLYHKRENPGSISVSWGQHLQEEQHIRTFSCTHVQVKEAVGWLLGMSVPRVRIQHELHKDNTQKNSGKPLLEHRAMENTGDKLVLLLPALTCLAAWIHAPFPYLFVVSSPPPPILRLFGSGCHCTAPGRLIAIYRLHHSINSETPVGSKVRIPLWLPRRYKFLCGKKKNKNKKKKLLILKLAVVADPQLIFSHIKQILSQRAKWNHWGKISAVIIFSSSPKNTSFSQITLLCLLVSIISKLVGIKAAFAQRLIVS